jgi:hypothetical protein
MSSTSDGRASRVLRGDGLGTAGFGKLGGRISNGISKAQKSEIHRRRAHVADGITPRVVGLGESEYLLATTGRGNGRWNGRHLEMTQDARDHRLLGDGGNDPE